jgi:hypothetical protein
LVTEVARPPVVALACVFIFSFNALATVFGAVIVRAVHYLYTTVLPLPRSAACALEIEDQVLTPTIVLARHSVAVVYVTLAIVAFEAIRARASKPVLTFHAHAIMETWRRGTFQHVYVTKVAHPTWRTGALIKTETINAVAIDTAMVHAIVRVVFAVLALPPSRAAACVVVHQVHAFTLVDAGGTKERALVDISLTIRPRITVDTQTNVRRNTILASATMTAGGRSTLVDLLLAMTSSKTFAAGTRIPVDAVGTEHRIWATGMLITFISFCFAPSAFVTGEADASEPGNLGKHGFQVKQQVILRCMEII